MFSATYFRYDGRWSGEFGLQIVDFDSNDVVESEVCTLTPTFQKASGSIRFLHGGIDCDSPPSCEFSVISEIEINAEMRSDILAWLVGRKQFKQLQFEGSDSDDFVYYCIFTSVKTIWVNGRCHGFRLTAQFDSLYARGNPTQVTVESGTHEIQLFNKSVINDSYTYPTVQFAGQSVDIVNKTDDTSRHFTFSGLSSGEIITVDNEARYIASNKSGEKLGKFTSKKWLRLVSGNNNLTIVSSGSVTITCPYYVMIGY